MDPSAEILTKPEFEKKVIFLDTNSLMGILCVNCYNHKTATELFNLSRELGVKFSVTSMTLKELKTVLDRSNERYALLNVPARILKRVNDEFISSYAYEKDVNASLTWQKYYERMSEPAFMLTKDFGIEIVNVDGVEVAEGKFFEIVTNEVSKVWKELRYNSKEDDIAEHDAFHLLYIKKLREDDKRNNFLDQTTGS